MKKIVISIGIILLIVLLATPNSFATPITLTGDGLGLSEGNYGSSLAVSDDLTLLAITRIGQSDWNGGLGVPGTIFVHQTDGIGVKGVDIDKDGNEKVGGSNEISGEKKHADEAIIFDYSVAVDLESIILGLNHIEFNEDDVTLVIDLFSDPDLTIPETSIESDFRWTGENVGYLEFSDLAEISGIDSLYGFSVRAIDGHFYVNNIDYAPTPEPSTILFFSSGLIGLAGFRRKLRKR